MIYIIEYNSIIVSRLVYLILNDTLTFGLGLFSIFNTYNYLYYNTGTNTYSIIIYLLSVYRVRSTVVLLLKFDILPGNLYGIIPVLN